jgi:hypothetical protein
MPVRIWEQMNVEPMHLSVLAMVTPKKSQMRTSQNLVHPQVYNPEYLDCLAKADTSDFANIMASCLFRTRTHFYFFSTRLQPPHFTENSTSKIHPKISDEEDKAKSTMS